jgi:hypothetical protein
MKIKMITQNNDLRPRTHRLLFSRLALSIGFLVIGGTALFTLMGLFLGELLWQFFILGLTVGIIAIVLSHLLISRPQKDPSRPSALAGLAGLILGYFMIIVAGLTTLFQIFFAEALMQIIIPLLIGIVGIGIVLWSKKLRK